jgi:hypothetical protein
MFALLQVIAFADVRQDEHDEWTVSGAEYVHVIRVDSDKARLTEFAAAYQYRFRAAVEDYNALDPGTDEWPELERVYDELSDKYRVTGMLNENTTFHIVKVDDGSGDDDRADPPAPDVRQPSASKAAA